MHIYCTLLSGRLVAEIAKISLQLHFLHKICKPLKLHLYCFFLLKTTNRVNSACHFNDWKSFHLFKLLSIKNPHISNWREKRKQFKYNNHMKPNKNNSPLGVLCERKMQHVWSTAIRKKCSCKNVQCNQLQQSSIMTVAVLCSTFLMSLNPNFQQQLMTLVECH